MIQDELRAFITEVANRVARPLLVEDDRQRVVAYSPQYSLADEMRREAILTGFLRPEVVEWSESFGIRRATGPVRTPPDPGRGILGRVCIPVRSEGVLVGFLWALDHEEPLDAASVDVLLRATAKVAVLLYRARVERQHGSDLLRALTSGSSRLRSVAAQDALVRDLLGPETVAMIAVVRDATSLVEVEAAIRGRVPRLLEYRNEQGLVALLPVRRLEASQIAAAIEAATAGLDVPALAIGLSAPSASPQALHRAYREAADAAWIVHLFPSVGRVGAWDRLGPYPQLVRAAATGDVADLMDPRLAAVLADPELALTLETYLDLGCQPKATAGALHVHRGTLYYRLQKIEVLTGADLGSGMDRLSLHVGLKLNRFRDPTSMSVPAAPIVLPRVDRAP